MLWAKDSFAAKASTQVKGEDSCFALSASDALTGSVLESEACTFGCYGCRDRRRYGRGIFTGVCWCPVSKRH